MKQFISIFVVGLISCLALINNGYAQRAYDKTLLAKNTKYLLTLIQPDTPSSGSANIILDKTSGISFKAIKDFNKSFKGATAVDWYKIVDGFLATFTQDNKFNRAFYDKKGNPTFTITYYDGKKLPRDIRAMVKSTYYDYDIPYVEEVNGGGKVVYFVHLEDEKSWKKLRVSEDGMEMIEDFTKN
jgi:hypothetical protein